MIPSLFRNILTFSGYAYKMAATPRNCRGKEPKTCSCFLPFVDRDSLEVCVNCFGQTCSVSLCCTHCEQRSVQAMTSYRNSMRKRRSGRLYQTLPLPLDLTHQENHFPCLNFGYLVSLVAKQFYLVHLISSV